jgi:creatinine amidohydrolase
VLAAEHVGVVVTPSIPTGLSEHHMAFGGTLTLSLPTLHALLRDICRSAIRAGFSRILIVNGHGGNMTALNALTTELTAELATPIAFASYFGAGRDVVRDTLETQDGLMHACEGETSMMMAAHPDLVRHGNLPQAHGPRITRPAESTDPLYMAVPFDEITESGVAGASSPSARPTPSSNAPPITPEVPPACAPQAAAASTSRVWAPGPRSRPRAW